MYQGTTFTIKPTWKINGAYVNMTDYTADMQVKQFIDSVSPTVEMSTANGRITIAGTTGTLTITLTATQTAALPAGNYLYELNVTAPDTTVTKLLSGAFQVIEAVI